MVVDVPAGRSLQEIIRRRQQHDFVGRERQVNAFRANLSLPLDDDRRRFVYGLHGREGVGKTWLLRRFSSVAQQDGVLTAWSDDAESDVVAVMERIAVRFEGQGFPMPAFTERLRELRGASSTRRRRDPAMTLAWLMASDPAVRPAMAPSHLPFEPPSLDGRVGTVGRRPAHPDDQSRGSGAEDRIHLLSSLFVAGLRSIAQERPVGLFFDAYERTAAFLDEWLRSLLEGCHGELPASTVIGIAGRDPLDEALWSAFEPVIARVPVEPFTEEEARLFLARKGITDDRAVAHALRVSQRLPVLLATIAQGGRDGLARLAGDPGDDPVSSYVRALDDPIRRDTLLEVALPRYLDAELMVYLFGRDSGPTIEWLRSLPFVEQRGGTWVLRESARRSLLRQVLRESPQHWSDRHGHLAAYYDEVADTLRLDDPERRADPAWQRRALESLYHRLCQSPRGFLPVALSGFVAAFSDQDGFARRWVTTIEQAGDDADDEDLRGWGRRLGDCLRNLGECRYDAVADAFSLLLTSVDLDERWRPEALAWQSRMLLAAGQHEPALRAYTDLVEIAPDVADYWIEKAMLSARLGYHERAVEDFGRALEIEPQNARALAGRGDAYRLLEAFSEALADFDRVLVLEPDNAAILGSRAQVLLQLDRFDEALADLNRAATLAPDDAWILTVRGCAYRSLERYDDALADLTRALRLAPDNVWTLAVRGDVYWQLKRFDAARSDFERALGIRNQSAG